MLGIYRKEMRAYLVSPIPYLIVIVFTAFMAWWFFSLRGFFVYRTASLDGFFVVVPWVFIFLVPAISMRLWSEEVRGGTLETLLALPVPSWQLVAGKFLSAATLLLLWLGATLAVPITVGALGNLDWGPVAGGYLGSLLMGAALLSLGLWLSALTGHQIVAFLLTAVAAFVLVIMGAVATQVGGVVGAAFERLSVAARFEAMGRGVLDLRDVLYFVTFAAFFLYLNVVTLESRRYR